MIDLLTSQHTNRRTMQLNFNRFLCALLATSLLSVSLATAALADSKPRPTPDQPEDPPTNIKRVIQHGRVLARPAVQPENTQSEVAYELGRCLQLDRDHCMVIASMDEQGGGDLCVGNDCFIIKKLSDIATAKPVALNRAQKDYVDSPGADKMFLAKYPAVGQFVPLGAKLPDGKPHPAAGTGILFSCAATFQADKTTQNEKSKRMEEIIQVRWDGKDFKVTDREIAPKLMELTSTGSTSLVSCPQDTGLLFSCGTKEEGVVVYRFDWNGEKWVATKHGKPFTKSHNETETSICHQGDYYYVQTRCTSAEGNLYRSQDGLDYEWVATLDSHAGSPKVLNQGLDGSLYVACNFSPGWVRNPLEAVTWDEDHFGKRFILHDQDGVRGDKGDSKPFVDHAIASNVFLEGRWRHLIFYRVCDLKERTLHGFQLKQGFGDIVYGKGKGPIPRRPWSGMYVVELEYKDPSSPPYNFN